MPNANCLHGLAELRKGPAIASFSAIAPDFQWWASGIFALSWADSLQSS